MDPDNGGHNASASDSHCNISGNLPSLSMPPEQPIQEPSSSQAPRSPTMRLSPRISEPLQVAIPPPATGASMRLPPIQQIEKLQVTTSATLAASQSRRRNEANFRCPVPGCNSTFTRKFNLSGHLRSHTEEKPFKCGWPGCDKGFARQHDCKRHQSLHAQRSSANNVCGGCGKQFSRTDALNRHLRSDGGQDCRLVIKVSKPEEERNSPSPIPNSTFDGGGIAHTRT